jgi:hypothetical protein
VDVEAAEGTLPLAVAGAAAAVVVAAAVGEAAAGGDNDRFGELENLGTSA